MSLLVLRMLGVICPFPTSVVHPDCLGYRSQAGGSAYACAACSGGTNLCSHQSYFALCQLPKFTAVSQEAMGSGWAC